MSTGELYSSVCMSITALAHIWLGPLLLLMWTKKHGPIPLLYLNFPGSCPLLYFILCQQFILEHELDCMGDTIKKFVQHYWGSGVRSQQHQATGQVVRQQDTVNIGTRSPVV